MESSPNWYRIALAEIGVAEVPGEKDNPKIQEYLRTVFNYEQHDEIAWCSAFVSWCMLKDGKPSTHSALARSWLSYGKEIKKPERGDIVIMSRGIQSWQGHVGFFDGMIGNQFNILGGNQGNKVCFQLFAKDKVLGIRRPL